MFNTHILSRCLSVLVLLCMTSAAASVVPTAGAQVFSGNGMGIEDAEDINTGGNRDLRETATEILFEVISYMGLIGVVVIVIAGIFLIVGGGSDESRTRAIKVILYVGIGLIVITLASAFVTFVISAASGDA